MKKRNNLKIIIGVIIAAIVIFAVIKFTSFPSAPKNYDSFAQCVAQSGAKMYGAYWCSHCQNQKAEFGDSFQYINYVECDANGENGNPAACQAAGISGYPTWIFSSGEKVPGEMSFEDLAQKTGCAQPN